MKRRLCVFVRYLIQCEKMSRYSRLKNIVKQRLSTIPKDLCEYCCLKTEHKCVKEAFHIIKHFDNVYTRRQSDQIFRFKLLEDILSEVENDTETIVHHLLGYEKERPWLINYEAEKENI